MTTCFLSGLYITLKLYKFKNNKNNLTILLDTLAYLLGTLMPCGQNRLRTCFPTCNVKTYATQTPSLKPLDVMLWYNFVLPCSVT